MTRTNKDALRDFLEALERKKKAEEEVERARTEFLSLDNCAHPPEAQKPWYWAQGFGNDENMEGLRCRLCKMVCFFPSSNTWELNTRG